ncbi:Asp-tRNA(Asn)/Glu-tRNA(Gln) amidotransferase subunit GatC [Candidatus Parcubacteria bacterium]|jgi:aspartyl-tRNA(Asn)/glutamyl-tRNA(Gln) amidotransferase subunit C|nr:Asp-tRNA(Asn)/Glu-tRNA(Gln) amidotransferase subunit GatC [Candidatus Parcubacteria bacterium]MBT3949251.1 Asp-tRNA(Asn)/Glu-tRNA(Gln) amidotransferase subunit GatC [Candidatus Parcubacteria bacterium]
MKLDKVQVEHIAKLARLELGEEEITMYTEQLSAVLGYIDMLDEVDVEGVEETSQVTGLQDVVRNDEVVSCDDDTRKKLLEQFPKNQVNLLKVKGVFFE